VDQLAGQLTLAELEREIAREAEATADLDRRTRVLKAEVAGWHSRPPSRPVQKWTWFERFLSVLGFLLAFFPAALTAASIASLVGFVLRYVL
jgi:hypothetical protein